MNDFISRQAAISVTWNAHNTGDACRELRALPSAQPERKKGEWINKISKKIKDKQYIDKHEAYMLIKHEAETHELPESKNAEKKMAEMRIDISGIVNRVVEQLKSDGFMVVKHGKWEHNRCTECGKSLDDLFSGDFYYDDEEVKFCPNCGAKMEGETE